MSPGGPPDRPSSGFRVEPWAAPAPNRRRAAAEVPAPSPGRSSPAAGGHRSGVPGQWLPKRPGVSAPAAVSATPPDRCPLPPRTAAPPRGAPARSENGRVDRGPAPSAPDPPGCCRWRLPARCAGRARGTHARRRSRRSRRCAGSRWGRGPGRAVHRPRSRCPAGRRRWWRWCRSGPRRPAAWGACGCAARFRRTVRARGNARPCGGRGRWPATAPPCRAPAGKRPRRRR